MHVYAGYNFSSWDFQNQLTIGCSTWYTKGSTSSRGHELQVFVLCRSHHNAHSAADYGMHRASLAPAHSSIIHGNLDWIVIFQGVCHGGNLRNNFRKRWQPAAFWTSWPGQVFCNSLKPMRAFQWPCPSRAFQNAQSFAEERSFLSYSCHKETKAIKPQLKMVCVTWNGQCGWISGWSFLKWLIFPGAFHAWATRLHSHFRGDASPKVTKSQSEEAALCWYLLGSCRRNRYGVYPWFSGTWFTFMVAFPMFPTSVGGSEGCWPLIIQGRSPWVGMLFEPPLVGVSQWLPSR